MQTIISLILSIIMALFAPTCGIATECGACGAHVHEWHYVANVNTGEPVAVCNECYSAYIENTALETVELREMEVSDEGEN